jgi:hypothetical protein
MKEIVQLFDRGDQWEKALQICRQLQVWRNLSVLTFYLKIVFETLEMQASMKINNFYFGGETQDFCLC